LSTVLDLFQIRNFTCRLSDGSVTEVVPGGKQIAITPGNRLQWVDLCELKRFYEAQEQINALLHGLSTIIPLQVFRLFTPSEVDSLVCGQPDYNVEELQKFTEYQDIPSDTPVVQHFWATMKDMTQQERSQFLLFVRGCARLDPSDHMVIQYKRDEATDQFPTARTCFFQLNLPPNYTSREAFRDKLITAIYNCNTMDLR